MCVCDSVVGMRREPGPGPCMRLVLKLGAVDGKRSQNRKSRSRTHD